MSTKNKVRLFTLITGILLVILITLVMINAGVHGNNGYLSSEFTNLGHALNMGAWPNGTVYDVLTGVFVYTVMLVGVILFIAWIIFAVKRTDKKALIPGAVMLLLFTFILMICGANAYSLYQGQLNTGHILVWFLVIFLFLTIVETLVLFIVMVRFLFEGEKGVVPTEANNGTSVVSNTTVIINNYYQDDEKDNDVEDDETIKEIVVIDDRGHFEDVAVNTYQRKPFVQQLAESDLSVKNIYNELKADFLSYGIKSRISKNGDTFRLHTKAYARIKVAGKGLKLYFALDPLAYTDSTFPVKDSGAQKMYKDIPLTFKVKSDLSIRRAKQLIADACAVDGLVEQEDLEFHTYDWANDAILNHYNDDNDGSDENIK